MAKLITTLGLSALLFAMQIQAKAAATERQADGCEILGRAISTAVLQAAESNNYAAVSKTNRKFVRSDPVTVSVANDCGNTTSTTTAAFSSAMSILGRPVGWSDTTPDEAGFCASHILSQCYPRSGGGNAAFSASQLRFVDNAWHAISAAVQGFMPYGQSANLSVFSPGILRLAMIEAVTGVE